MALFRYIALAVVFIAAGVVTAADENPLRVGNFNFRNFQNRPHLNLNGDSASQIGELVLTQPQLNQAGAIWFDEALDISKGFDTSFQFVISQTADAGADGLALVFQRDSPYALGRGGSGIGYDGLGEGFAIEFDTRTDPELGDPNDNHVSIHDARGSGDNLSAKEQDAGAQGGTASSSTSKHEGDVVVRPIHATTGKLPVQFAAGIPVTVVVSYSAHNGDLVVKVKRNVDSLATVLTYHMGEIKGVYWVGFTSATGNSGFARVALREWEMKAGAHGSACMPGFTGKACSVTNSEAAKECPRRLACNMCVEDVYNCAWCVGDRSIGGKDHCVVGTVSDTAHCASLALEPPTCSESLTQVWLYALLFSFIFVLAFGVVVFKTLPLVQSFRAISLLVSLVGGAFTGMVLSFVVSVSLVEISETPFFAIAYGLFYLFMFGLLVHHIRFYQLPERGYKMDSHVWLLCFAALWVLASGILCFLVERSWVHWLPSHLKTMFYTVLGGSLNFCIVVSFVDVFGAFASTWSDTAAGVGDGLSKSLMNSLPHVSILTCASLLSGCYFGFMFGTLRVGEESSYRLALALQQESVFTYPVGAAIGAMSSVLILGIQLPRATDDEIDRLIRSANDDL